MSTGVKASGRPGLRGRLAGKRGHQLLDRLRSAAGAHYLPFSLSLSLSLVLPIMVVPFFLLGNFKFDGVCVRAGERQRLGARAGDSVGLQQHYT